MRPDDRHEKNHTCSEAASRRHAAREESGEYALTEILDSLECERDEINILTSLSHGLTNIQMSQSL